MATPRKKESGKSKGGRKWFDGQNEDLVITKLEEVWGIDGTDAEAAFFAGISTASLSRYLDAHPAVAERKAALKERPVLLARRAVIESFDGHKVKSKDEKGNEIESDSPKSPDLALKYLERKRRHEFATKSEMDVNSKTLEQLLEEANKKEGEGTSK
jgi:hypothetical protein